MREINHEEMQELVKLHYETMKPMFIFGTVGIGKSQGIRDAAKRLADDNSREYIEWNDLNRVEKNKLLEDKNVKDAFILGDLRASQLEPSDLQIPDIAADTRHLERKYDLLFEVLSNDNAKGILFFDELNLAPPTLQASLYQIIHDNEFGDIKLSDGVFRIGAGNESEDVSNVFEMGDALNDRFSIYRLTVPTIEEWSEWAVENGVDSRILSFLQCKRSYLHAKNVGGNKDIVKPTPRSWAITSDLINDVSDVDKIELFSSGRLGDGVAIEFQAHCKMANTIDIREYIDSPEDIELPEEPDMLYTIITELIGIYREKRTKKVLKAIAKLANRLPAEFSMLMLRLGCKTGAHFSNIMDFEEFDELGEEFEKYLDDV